MSEDRVRALAQKLWDAVYKIADPSTLDEVPEKDRAEKLQLIACEALSAAPRPRSAAAADVLAERLRQVEAEGWTSEHDDAHSDRSMALAGACYAMFAAAGDRARASTEMPAGLTVHSKRIEGWAAWLEIWPWERSWWKPTDRRRDLVKAAALIIAEIERLDRAAIATSAEDGR